MKILVTGTSSGLGKEIAEDLSKDHDIVGCARRNLQTDSFEHIPNVDFENPDSFDLLRLNQFDALINNAGMAEDGLLAIQSERDITRVINVNLISTLILTKRYVRERLASRKSGVVINVSSIVSIRGYAGLVAYSASKAGLDASTRALARELGSKGFRVNSILPGFMETDMVANLSQKQRDQIIRRTPLGRFTTTTEVIKVVKFLISDEASAITGQSIVIDGGITI